jgi:hypothetical protein
MKKMALISVLFFMSGCTIAMKSDLKKDDQDVCVEKEFYFGPKVGKN